MKSQDLMLDRLIDGPGEPYSRDWTQPLDDTSSAQAVESTHKRTAARARRADKPALLRTDAENAEHSGDLYKAILRDAQLLSRQQEETLGAAVQESREKLTSSLSRVPAAFGVYVRLMRQADAGKRPITDALFAPFEAFKAFKADDRALGAANRESVSDRKDWRRTVLAARRLHDEWRMLVSKSHEPREIDGMRARIATIASGLQPGFVALGEALRVCQKLDHRVSLIEQKHGAFHADILSRTPSVAPRGALLRIQAEAGIDLTTLRECCAEAASAHATYEKARTRMINANLRLAYYMAHRLRGNGLSFDDLVQAAILGLMRAVDKFDYRLGYKFSTYAVQWIRQSTTRSIADDSRTIRVATHMHDEIVRLRRLSRELEQTLSRKPSVAEIAEVAGIAEAKVELAFQVERQPVSLDAPPAVVEDSPLSSIIVDTAADDPQSSAHDERLAATVAAILDELPAREALIVRLRYGIDGREGHTLEEIGRMLGITRERTRQLEARAFGRLRETVDPELLRGLAQ